jgi:hypothetical protein
LAHSRKTIGKLAGEKGAAINALLNGKAGLAYVYAFDDRLIFSVNSEDGPLGISPSDFLALPGATGLGAIFNLEEVSLPVIILRLYELQAGKEAISLPALLLRPRLELSVLHFENAYRNHIFNFLLH